LCRFIILVAFHCLREKSMRVDYRAISFCIPVVSRLGDPALSSSVDVASFCPHVQEQTKARPLSYRGASSSVFLFVGVPVAFRKGPFPHHLPLRRPIHLKKSDLAFFSDPLLLPLCLFHATQTSAVEIAVWFFLPSWRFPPSSFLVPAFFRAI